MKRGKVPCEVCRKEVEGKSEYGMEKGGGGKKSKVPRKFARSNDQSCFAQGSRREKEKRRELQELHSPSQKKEKKKGGLRGRRSVHARARRRARGKSHNIRRFSKRGAERRGRKKKGGERVLFRRQEGTSKAPLRRPNTAELLAFVATNRGEGKKWEKKKIRALMH